jgi:hypothetical protein
LVIGRFSPDAFYWSASCGSTPSGAPIVLRAFCRQCNAERVSAGWNAMMNRLGLGLLCGAALANAAWAQGVSQFDGQYVGELALTGIISGDCTTPPVGAEYPLTIAGGQVHFRYVPRFDTELVGRIGANGSFKATGKTKTGAVTMTGHITGYHNLTADIVSPSCRYSFQTKN